MGRRVQSICVYKYTHIHLCIGIHMYIHIHIGQYIYICLWDPCPSGGLKYIDRRSAANPKASVEHQSSSPNSSAKAVSPKPHSPLPESLFRWYIVVYKKSRLGVHTRPMVWTPDSNPTHRSPRL